MLLQKSIFKLVTPILFIGFCSVHVHSQNLVPNPSFEDYSECPPDLGIGDTYIDYADGWDFFAPTPDFYHTCGGPNVSVPDNYLGSQEAATGEGYAGFYAYQDYPVNAREGIITQLSSPLVVGQTYYCSFKISLAEKSAVACNNIGMLFRTEFNPLPLPYPTSDIYNQVNYSQVYTSEIIMETVDWVTVSGSFVADSSYAYVSFSNHFDNNLTDTLVNPGLWHYAYYYIDDICVSSNPDECELVNSISNVKNGLYTQVYPTLVKSKVNIDLDRQYKVISVELYSYTGQLLKINKFQNSKSLELDVNNLPKGMYILKIKADSKSSVNKIIKA